MIAAALLVAGVPVVAAEDAPVFRFEGRDYAIRDVSPTLRRLHFELEVEVHARRLQLIDEMLYEAYLAREAEREGRSPREISEALLAVEPPSEAAARAFYEAHRERLDQPFEDVRSRILAHLHEQGVRVAKADLIARLKRDGAFELLVPAPRPPPVDIDVSGFPTRGPEEAPALLVEFGDLHCPMCRRARAVIDRIQARYPEELRIAWLHFPADPDGVAGRIARGSVCAQRQGRFWDYHGLAFDRQETLDDAAPERLAEALGLDLDGFRVCMASRAPGVMVARGVEQARRLGISASPAVYLDGQPFRTTDLEGELRRRLEARFGR